MGTLVLYPLSVSTAAGFVAAGTGGFAVLPADPGGLAVGLSAGMFASSILGRLRGRDDGDADADEGDDLMDDGLSGGLDDGLDDLGEFDDWGDEFGGGDEEEGTRELENRVDELEKELASLSSTVSTVRSENEQISETVDDVAENVRSLLDIYEMVTRGINPFVDDVSTGGGFDDQSFGLFGDDDDAEDPDDDDLDESIASADAEGFFDEELVDGEDPDDGSFEEEFAAGADLDGDEEEFAADRDETDDTEPDMSTDHDTDGSKTFSELKDEYESGEADWADDAADDGSFEEAFAAGADPDGFDDGFDEAVMDADPGFDDPDEEATVIGGADPAADALDAGDAPADATTGGEEDAAPDGSARGDDPDVGGFQFVDGGGRSARREKPYLRELPGDYVGDLVVMEWLEYLVERADATDAVRAVNYYERIEWVDGEVAETLRAFLEGFGDVDRNLVDEPGTATLTLADHTRSLKYIMQLTAATAESVVLDRWDAISGGRDGL